jgi:hypothetical protein
MPEPTWRKIIERMKIPGAQGVAWTRVLDYVTPGKVMKIEVATADETNADVTGKWKPADFTSDCTADGDYSGTEPVGKTARQDALVSTAPLGALVGRIGGSAADKSVDTTQPPATPNRLVFSVGRHCVFVVPSTPSGALYLSVNDNPPNMVKLTGNLLVDVYEAL